MCKYAIPKTTPNILYGRKEFANPSHKSTCRLTNPNPPQCLSRSCPYRVKIAGWFGSLLLM